MSAFESIVERRIRAAQEAGLFDDLDGAGEPIADIDRMRPPGWWATRLAARERSKLRAEQNAAVDKDNRTTGD
ncbi:MAG: DnaJ family domain-containing protein [Actinomycetota bacterium]